MVFILHSPCPRGRFKVILEFDLIWPILTFLGNIHIISFWLLDLGTWDPLVRFKPLIALFILNQFENKPGQTASSQTNKWKLIIHFKDRIAGGGGRETYNRFISFFYGDPVFPVGANVYSVSLDVVFLLGFLWNSSLCPDSSDKAQKAQVYLQDNTSLVSCPSLYLQNVEHLFLWVPWCSFHLPGINKS